MKRSLMRSLLLGAAGASLALSPACSKSAETPAAPVAAPTAAAPAEAPAAAEAAPVAAEAAPAAEGAEAAPAVAPNPGEEAPRLTGAVAKVNGTPIPATEFYAELDKITARGAKIPEDRLARIQQNILKRLIEKELVRQAVTTAKIAVTDDEIAAAYTEYKKRFQTDE